MHAIDFPGARNPPLMRAFLHLIISGLTPLTPPTRIVRCTLALISSTTQEESLCLLCVAYSHLTGTVRLTANSVIYLH